MSLGKDRWPGGLERMAAELPSGLRAVGGARLLQLYAAEAGGGDSPAPHVLAIGLVGSEPALVTSVGGQLALVRELPGVDTLFHLEVASVVAGETVATGRWDAASHSLLLHVLDNELLELSDVTFATDTPWTRPNSGR